MSKFAGGFSARTRQIGRNVERYEKGWRVAHPGQEPGSDVLQAWDRRAWAEARPDKVVPSNGTVLTDRWVEELHRLGYQAPKRSTQVSGARIGLLDRNAAVAAMVSRLGAKRSAWNAADLRGQAEQLIARSDVVADAAVRIELAEDLTARAIGTCLSLLDAGGIPEHIRTLTSREVVALADQITASFAFRAVRPGVSAIIGVGGGLDESQLAAVATLAGGGEMVLIEGPAGAGKTATLATTRDLLAQSGRRMVVVTPTLKAARVAAAGTGADAYSAAWLARQYGYANRHVELAYASTVYGVQGETADAARLVLSETTGAASAYVAMTRGRQNNVVHIVAGNLTTPVTNGCGPSPVTAPILALATRPSWPRRKPPNARST